MSDEKVDRVLWDSERFMQKHGSLKLPDWKRELCPEQRMCRREGWRVGNCARRCGLCCVKPSDSGTK